MVLLRRRYVERTGMDSRSIEKGDRGGLIEASIAGTKMGVIEA
jgi:hypothetical protein